MQFLITQGKHIKYMNGLPNAGLTVRFVYIIEFSIEPLKKTLHQKRAGVIYYIVVELGSIGTPRLLKQY